MRKTKVKKVGDNFLGECELRQLPKGALFTRIGGKTIYVKNHYNPDDKTYSCSKYYDINDEKFIKGTTKVSTNFNGNDD